MNSLTLALSGGGAKGAAHAGVLAVLAEARLPVAAIAGTSAGGVVAVLHGLGYSPAAIRDYFAETNLLDVWELDSTRRAIFGVEKIRARVRAMVGDKTFADLALPVTVVAVDANSGRQARVNSGRLDEALLATTAIPGIFTPLIRERMTLVDGGVMNPLPVDVARALGSPVVAVDILHDAAPPDTGIQLFESRGPMRYATEVGRRLGLLGIVEAMHYASGLATQQLTEYNLRLNPPDVLLRPQVGPIGLFAFDLADAAFKQGEQAARAALPQLKALARPRLNSAAAWRMQLKAIWLRVQANIQYDSSQQ